MGVLVQNFPTLAPILWGGTLSHIGAPFGRQSLGGVLCLDIKLVSDLSPKTYQDYRDEYLLEKLK